MNTNISRTTPALLGILVCTVALSTQASSPTEVVLPTRIRLRTSDEFNLVLADIANALTLLTKTEHTQTIKLHTNVFISFIGCALACCSIPYLLKNIQRWVQNPSFRHISGAATSSFFLYLGLEIIRQAQELL